MDKEYLIIIIQNTVNNTPTVKLISKTNFDKIFKNLSDIRDNKDREYLINLSLINHPTCIKGDPLGSNLKTLSEVNYIINKYDLNIVGEYLRVII